MGDALAEDLLMADADQGAILTRCAPERPCLSKHFLILMLPFSVLVNAYQCQLTSWYDLWVPEGTTDTQVQSTFPRHIRVRHHSINIGLCLQHTLSTTISELPGPPKRVPALKIDAQLQSAAVLVWYSTPIQQGS
jgi:hypothetical protein